MNQTLLSAVIVVFLIFSLSCQSTHTGKMNPNTSNRVTKTAWGRTTDGTPVDVYTLSNTKGMRVKIATYGATITELHVPDRNGADADIVLGYSNIEGFRDKDNPYFGATIGRYANRIAKGRFTI